jgi:chromosome transmission fidelity protein 4
MGWAAVATSKNMLRVFSSTGTQLHVIRLVGPVVCLCGSGAQLAVVYNHAPLLSNEAPYQVSVEIFAIKWRRHHIRPVVKHIVPLSPRAKLEWMGFDMDSGNVAQ